MTLDPALSLAIARGRADAGPREWPVAVLLTPIPLDLFAQIGTAIADALDDLGYRAQLREVTGASVIWAVQVDGDLVELPGGDDG